MRKIFGLILALLLCVALLSGCSDKSTKAEFFLYVVETDGTASITGYIGNEKAVVIPKKIDGHKVWKIEAEAFANNTLIEKVVLHDGITFIGNSAFSGCNNLLEIVMPKQMDYIGAYAFMNTGISNIIVPEGLNGIQRGTFEYCSIKSITLPQSLAYIEDRAFYSCSALKEITIPDYVHSIGDNAFTNCYSLESIVLPSRIPSGYEEFAEIGDYAFAGCYKLKSITIPEGVHTIGGGAFQMLGPEVSTVFYGDKNTALEEITIPESVNLIKTDYNNGEYGQAFFGCKALKIINVKEGSYAAEYFSDHPGLTFY